MKNTINLLMFLICLFFLSSCNKSSLDNNSYEKQLLSVLKSEITFVAEDGKNIYLNEFVYGNDGSTELFAKPQEYAFVDFNDDGVDELVAEITPNRTYYMVFHKNNEDIYGFLIGRRSLQGIKDDGSFIQSAGAGINYYCKMEFDNDSYKVIYIAIKNVTDSIYKINGKKSTIEAVNEYIEDWNLKQEAKWIKVS